MIVSGDKRASSAFLEGLVTEPPSSVTPLNGRNILQVSGLEQAIAVADDGLRQRARTKSEPPAADLFDTLVSRDATDDVSAPAIYRPYVPTPIPPPLSADHTMVMAIPRPGALPSFPAPIVVLDRDLFFHPPLPSTQYAPLAPRKSGLALIVAIIPIAMFFTVIAIFGGSWSERPHVVQTTSMVAPTAPAPTTSAAPIASTRLVHPDQKIMSVEVKQLKTAPPPTKRRH